MLCKIADLLVEIPKAGGMAPRCGDYLAKDNQGSPDIIINESKYRSRLYPDCNENSIAYIESGFMFYIELMRFGGLMLHSSAVEYEGKAYLFSGPCGMGKSTHARLWQQVFGPAAQVFNDDKPALRCMDGRWYAYGTPWCGKDGINQNKKVPLAGICFLKRGQENQIRRLSQQEAAIHILWQTQRYRVLENLERHLPIVDKLATEIPVYEMCNNAKPDCAQLSYETMCRGAQEAGL